jgi:cell division GTPase FtsZ
VALEDALNSRWLAAGGAAGRTRRVVALTAGREISVGEAAAIRERLHRERAAGEAVLLGLGLEGTLGDEARCLVLVRPAPSENVVSIEMGQ